MKLSFLSVRTALLCLFIGSSAILSAGPYDLWLPQRNATDSGSNTRVVSFPEAGTVDGLVAFIGATKLPDGVRLGHNLFLLAPTSPETLYSLELVVDYAELTSKPTLFSGAYSDLTGKPTLFSGAYSDLTGKPTLFSGAYADLSGKPTLFSGSYTDLTNKPSIPAAQIQADWNQASSGSLDFIKNKPTIPGAVTVSGSNGITVVLSSGNYTVSKTKRQETYTGTTDASGNYAVTFGTAYGSTPNIQAGLINANNKDTAILTRSTTGFNVYVQRRADVLGLLPSYSNVSGAVVDVIVTEN